MTRTRFFFDKGHVDGDEMMRQINQVAHGFELACTKVATTCFDAESENARDVKLFNAASNVSENESWIDETHVCESFWH